MSTARPVPYDRQNSTGSAIASDNAAHIAGKIVLTTGVSPNGTGALFVETIAKHNPALLILAGRNPTKIQATVDKIASINPSVKVRLLALDLTSQASVRRAAEEVNAYAEPYIDVLVNNAGIMAGPYRKTEDGIELQFGVNHIGHFLFTNLIIEKVLSAPKPRIVNISSDGHRASPIRFDDYNFANGKTYNQWEAYGQSKTANILFTKSLASFPSLTSRGLHAFSVHPGVLMTTSLATRDALSEADFVDLKRLDKSLGEPLGEDGAQFDVKTEDEMVGTHVVAAFDPRLEGEKWNGSYMEDGNVHNERLRKTATNPQDPERLWELSEKLVGQKFAY